MASASKSLLDRLMWQFHHLWREGDVARLSVECDHDGKAFASLHVDLGVQHVGQRGQRPVLPTNHPSKSTHTQTEPNNQTVAMKTANASHSVATETTD